MGSPGCTCIRHGWMIPEQETRKSGVSRVPTRSVFIVKTDYRFLHPGHCYTVNYSGYSQ